MKILDIITESHNRCPHCGGPLVSESELMEKKDACYYKIKSSAKVWPSAYASGRLVQCRKKGAANYGNKKKVDERSLNEFAPYDHNDDGEYDDEGDDELRSLYDTKFELEAELDYADEEDREHLESELEDVHARILELKPDAILEQGVAEGSGGNWYIRVNGKILNDTKFKPVIFSSEDEARSHAMKLADKKRIPLSQMKLTKSWMDAPEQGVAEGLDEAVGGNYLYYSRETADEAKQILSSGYILGNTTGKQPASDAQTTLPTVSFGRNIGYQTSGANVDRDYQVVFVFDRASIETRYKTLGTSQSQTVRGLANPIDTEWGRKVDKLGKVWGLDANADGKVDYKEIGNASKSTASNLVKQGVSTQLNAPKAGGEFEEIVPTKTGKIPLQGLLVGFYLVPGKAASKDPELLNDPRRLDMPRPNQFVKANQAQGVAEGENWSKHNNKRAGGMSKKSVASYRRSHPGSKIQTAVTTKPSKLKKGSKSAKRRASFCARMRGMKKHRTGAKTAHDPNSNINKSLRRWHCESIEELHELVMLAEQFIRNNKK